MPGMLTRRLGAIAFKQRNKKPWTIIQTPAKCEKAVQKHLNALGIENYLPFITTRDERGGETTTLQTPRYIFACWDCQEFPRICTPQNKMHQAIPNRRNAESSVIASMVYCRRLELISEYYPVQVVSLEQPPSEQQLISSGPLAGTTAYIETTNDTISCYLSLDDFRHYAKIALTPSDLKESK